MLEMITPSGSSAAAGGSSTNSGSTPTAALAACSLAGSYAARFSEEISVNSQPGRPLNDGSSSEGAALANRTLHLQLDQPVHLDGVLHRELLGDRLDEAVDDQLRGLLLGDAVRHQVEELVLTDLRNRRLVPDVDVVLADADR